jgi:hypothetical protein
MVRRAVVVLALLAAMTVTVGPTPAGAAAPASGWRQQSPATVPALRNEYSLFSDPSTGQTVMFGGRNNTDFLNDTWLWTGSNWALQSPATSPFGVGRNSAAVAFDPRIGDPILFGGTILTPQDDVLNYADTWRWTGTTWTNIPTQHFPAARNDATMAFDPVSGQLILFGGANINGWFNDTWAFNGTDWSQLSPASSPAARAGATMSVDPATGRLLLYGGDSNAGVFNDTWTWTGSNWQQLSPTTSPGVGYESAMTVDQSTGRPVLFGGWGGGGGQYSGALWDWTGTSWVKRTVASAPGGRLSVGLAYDANTGRLVTFGGALTVGGIGNDTWTFGPIAPDTGWNLRSPGTSPPARSGAAIAYDGSTGQLVMFGGTASNGSVLADTWVWNGSNWTNAAPATTPAARSSAAMGFDERTGQLIMYGGYGGNSTYRSDTWEWTGTNWTPRAPAASPGARTAASMAYNPELGRLMLFGGWDGSGVAGFKADTWVWTGTNWQQLTTPVAPSGRSNASMTFDPSTGNLLLYGGANASTTFNETWVFDNGAWAPRSPATTPSGISQSMMAFDARLGDVVLFGGYRSGLQNATWAWNGTTWRQLSTSGTPSIRDLAALAYAPNTGQLVMFGGRVSGFTPTNETYTGVVIGESTPPSISVSHTANGLNGWTTTTPTTITITASDAGSGLAGKPTCLDVGNGGATPLTVSGSAPNFTTSVSGQGSHSVQCDVSDLDGNHAFDTVLVKIDSVKPTVNVTAPTTSGGNFTFTFSEPVDIDPNGGSVSVIETENATTVTGALSCPGGLNGTGRCATWTFNPDGRLFPGDYYDVYFQPANGGLTDAAGNAMNPTFPNVRAATTVDNTDPEVTFQWGTLTQKGNYGGSVLRERTGGATASYTFKGKKLTWYTVRGPNQGSARVQITDANNSVDTVIDNYATTTTKKVPLAFGGLSKGKHTITITVQGGLSDPAATDSFASIDAFQVGTNAVVGTPKPTSHWNDDFSYSFTSSPGSRFSVQFRGTSVSWTALFGLNNGIARVLIDGVPIDQVDLYASSYFFSGLTYSGLSDSVHTLKVVNTGQKNPASDGTVVSVDRVELN